jgi:succinoglycan biosynthesis transport protein ExoP
MSEENVAVRGRLQQLESISDTYEEVYRQYLGRYQVAVQQQGFPIASVNVISRAEVPTGASSPRKKAMLVAGAFLGGFIGVMIAALRELRAKPVRTPSTLRKDVGIDCAGLLPSGRRGEGDAERRTRARTLERLALTCEHHPAGAGGTLIGIAPLTNESSGQGDLTTDLARILSRNDRRSVLIIGEGGSSEPARAPAALPAAPGGGVTRVSMQAVRDRHDGQTRPGPEPQDDGTLIGGLCETFDFVLLEMPPLSQSNGSEADSLACDIAILRVPWGKVLPGFVADALKDNPVFEARLATAVLEGADLRSARRYMGQGSYEERETYA